MKLKKIFTTGFMAASLLALTACSSSHGSGVQDGYANGGGPNGSGVAASGLGAGTSFGADGGPGGSTLTVGNQSYYFDFDSNAVHDSDMASIKVQGNYLATHPNAKVLLTGNTDERGSREYNIGLGQRRADAVASALEADGASSNQITTVSYGSEKPVAFGHDEDSYSKNRRVDLVYQSQ